MGFEKIKYFTAQFNKSLANKHLTIFRKRVKSGTDYSGGEFDKYTEKYAVWKKKGKGHAQTSTRTAVPDLTLSGQMLRGLHFVSAHKQYYTIGWRGEPAEKVQWNLDNGRNIADGIPDKEHNFLFNQVVKQVDKEWKKIPPVTRIKA
jgi:hypothetical protein